MTAGVEIERQFLLSLPAERILADAKAAGTHLYSCLIEQSYIPDTGVWTIRTRRTVIQNADADETFEQTRKRRLAGIARHESATPLDREGYESLLVDCGPTLRKMRVIRQIGLIPSAINPIRRSASHPSMLSQHR